MFADDTNLFLSGINVDDLFSDMNCELNKISLWFKANKLSLNLTKTNILYFIQSQREYFKKNHYPSRKWIILSLKYKMLQNFLVYLLVVLTLLMKTSHGNST